jgi:Predicted membrane protein/domain
MSQLIETEETLIIETPERVQLGFALASIGNRFLAVVIDHFLQFFTIFIVTWAFLSLSSVGETMSRSGTAFFVEEMPKWTIALMIIVLFLIFTGYFIFFEWLWNGQTPGKRLLKLRVIREDGRPITFWEAAARNLLRIFDTFPGFVMPLYSVGLIAIFMSRRDQRIGDLFAGTVVVRERGTEAPTFAEVFSTSVTDPAMMRLQKPTHFTGDLRGVTEDEIEVVEAFLRRRIDLNDRQRQWMAWRVALPIMYKIKPQYDLQTFTYEGFLEELVHRYHERHRFIN